jgi:hypothetical protein
VRGDGEVDWGSCSAGSVRWHSAHLDRVRRDVPLAMNRRVVLVVAVALLAACGSDGDPESGPRPRRPRPAT